MIAFEKADGSPDALVSMMKRLAARGREMQLERGEEPVEEFDDAFYDNFRRSLMKKEEDSAALQLGIVLPWPTEEPADWKCWLESNAATCSNQDCAERATMMCPKCRVVGLSFACRSAYCSNKECQVADWQARHKRFHVMLQKPKSLLRYEETVVLSLLELKARGRLPALDEAGCLSILFAGARDEGAMNFHLLLLLLKELVYCGNGSSSEIRKLSVCLCGKNAVSGQPSTPDVKIQVRTTLVEKAFPTAKALSDEFDLVYIIAPGFTDFIPEWSPAIDLMLQASLPIVVTSYAMPHQKDNDALFDEPALVVLFRANKLVGTTLNCMHDPNRRGALGHKNCAYSIYCGKDEALPPAPSRLEFMRDQTIRYLRYQAECYKMKEFAEVADKLASGDIPYRQESKMQPFVDLANRMRC